MTRWVEIQFDCLPLRSVQRLDVPLDASPRFREHCERVKRALETHGSHNTYYLHRGTCIFHLLNHETLGRLEFEFCGTLFTDGEDMQTRGCDLEVALTQEAVDWLTQPIVDWFGETVRRAVVAEFDRYIQAGDLQQTKERIERLNRMTEESQGYLGMDL